MLKINLTPEEELENPLWYVPDLAIFALVLAIGYLAVQVYLNGEREKKAILVEETFKINEQTQALDAEVKRLEVTIKELDTTKEKLSLLLPVATEGLDRYLQIMVLEHLQNLKPEGLWFRDLSFSGGAALPTAQLEPPKPGERKEAKSADEFLSLTVTGFAFDNIIVAEFLTSLRATQTQDIDPSDVRTHVYFPGFILQQAVNVSAETGAFPGMNMRPEEGEEIPKLTDFTIKIFYTKRNTPAGADLLSSVGEFPVDTHIQLATMSRDHGT